MDRRESRGEWEAVGCAVFLAVFLAGCAAETECEFADEPVGVRTGDVALDINRCWQGIGVFDLRQDPAFLVVYDFTPPAPGGRTGVLREVQSPNRLYPNGHIFEVGYRFVTDGGTPVIDLGLSGGGLPPAQVEVTDTSLLMRFQVPTAQGVVVAPQALRRARACVGFGFDQPTQRCEPVRTAP